MEQYVVYSKTDHDLGDMKKDLKVGDISFTFLGYDVKTTVEAETSGEALSKAEKSLQLLFKWISLLFNNHITVKIIDVTDKNGRKGTRTINEYPVSVKIKITNYEDIVMSKLELLERRSKMIICPDNDLLFALDSIVLGNQIRTLKGFSTTRYAILEYSRAIEKLIGTYKIPQVSKELRRKNMPEYVVRVKHALKIRNDYNVAHAYRNKSADLKDADYVRDVAKDIFLKLTERPIE